MANTSSINEIRGLIAKSRLKEAGKIAASMMLSSNPELRDEVSAWEADLTELETQSRRDAVTRSEYARHRKRLALTLLDICHAHETELNDDKDSGAVGSKAGTPVFLSYNHLDAEASLAVRAALKDAGIRVEIDIDAMEPGESIKDFIQRSIRATGATVGILSRHSLMSEWVARETMLTLLMRDLWRDRCFVGCFLDTSFLYLDFRLNATRTIDDRIAEIDKMIPEYTAMQLDTNDLNSRKSRLYALRNGLGEILEHLRDSLCLDIRPEAREDSLARLVDYLGTQRRNR